ncbi:uncharacterized protein LOC131619358 [Vicia villosa]|uniref:uncharacterized protein LOC131619358 n=1 Tax=Vicia villosa TaxID=3911 RepID=UPI00273C08DC|nr:uncharacterized protein LOC131619358 [Vicia villosa]
MWDPWLRENGCCWVSGPQVQEVHDLFVKDLLLPNVKQWDVGKVNSLFDHVGAASILRVPLVEDVVEDRLVWHEEKNGVYSVKSGYRLWRGVQSRSTHYDMGGNWKSLWNISAPSRAKHLLWRICRGCLPTRYNLQQHHVPCPSLCPWCDLQDEDDCREDRRVAGRFAVMLEVLWRSRNNVVWQDDRQDAIRIGLQAYYNWYDWFLAREDHIRDVNNNHPVVWIPPMLNHVKCNVDAGFNNVCGTTNRGCCFRDHLGRIIKGGVSWDVGFLSVHEAEAMALKEAIHHASSSHFSHVTFESDCQLVVNSIRAKNAGPSEFSLIIKSIQNLLSFFPNFKVKFIKRQANSVAHTLTKAANSWSRRSFFNLVPPCIEFCLMNESC